MGFSQFESGKKIVVPYVNQFIPLRHKSNKGYEHLPILTDPMDPCAFFRCICLLIQVMLSCADVMYSKVATTTLIYHVYLNQNQKYLHNTKALDFLHSLTKFTTA